MPAKIVPCLRCADAPAAIAWLCEACGFERRLVVPDGNGGTAHAELTLGDGMIMLGSRGDGEYDGLQALLEGAGTVTQAPYIVVSLCGWLGMIVVGMGGSATNRT